MKKSTKIKLFCGAVVALSVPLYMAVYFMAMNKIANAEPINAVMADVCSDIFVILVSTFALLSVAFVPGFLGDK